MPAVMCDLCDNSYFSAQIRFTDNVSDSIPASIGRRFGDSDARPLVLHVYDIRTGWAPSKRQVLTQGLITQLLADGITVVQAQWRQQKKMIGLNQLDVPVTTDGTSAPSGIELTLIDGGEVITIIPALWPVDLDGWRDISPASHNAVVEPEKQHLRVTVTVQVESMGSFPESPEVGVDKIAPLVRVVDVFDDTADGLKRAITSAQRMSSLDSPGRHSKPNGNGSSTSL